MPYESLVARAAVMQGLDPAASPADSDPDQGSG